MSFKISDYNPDVLSCIANLSSDEVFTTPQVANTLLDLLPTSIWGDPSTKILDPCSKTGIFLRESAKRFEQSLTDQIPDLQARIDHILVNQLYGSAITELTALISRRTLYCSKTANSENSICQSFADPQGNIRAPSSTHLWQAGKCSICGAAQAEYDRGDLLESYAYDFIHQQTTQSQQLFQMKFDVIIGNPPYQLSDGGAQKSASPIYHLFIEQAIKLNPRYLVMIVPARWYNGGKGLDDFRAQILADNRFVELHDYPDTSDCFPGVNIRGGVCYFLWDRNHKGDCKVINYNAKKPISTMTRALSSQGDTGFIRFNRGVEILEKVSRHQAISFSSIVSPRNPFGLPTNFKDFASQRGGENQITIYMNRKRGFITKSQVGKNAKLVDRWKVLVPYASPGDDSYPHLILSNPIVAPPGSCCTETYLIAGDFDSELLATNAASYLRTTFARFLILLTKSAHHIYAKNYAFVPLKDFSREYNDPLLAMEYGLTHDDSEYMKSLVKPIG